MAALADDATNVCSASVIDGSRAVDAPLPPLPPLLLPALLVLLEAGCAMLMARSARFTGIMNGFARSTPGDTPSVTICGENEWGANEIRGASRAGATRNGRHPSNV